PRPLVLPPRMIAIPQPPQRRKALCRVPHVPAELAGPDIDTFYLWSHGAPGTPQRRAERELQRQLLLGTLARLGERLEHLEPPGHVADRLDVGGALERP